MTVPVSIGQCIATYQKYMLLHAAWRTEHRFTNSAGKQTKIKTTHAAGLHQLAQW